MNCVWLGKKRESIVAEASAVYIGTDLFIDIVYKHQPLYQRRLWIGNLAIVCDDESRLVSLSGSLPIEGWELNEFIEFPRRTTEGTWDIEMFVGSEDRFANLNISYDIQYSRLNKVLKINFGQDASKKRICSYLICDGFCVEVHEGENGRCCLYGIYIANLKTG